MSKVIDLGIDLGNGFTKYGEGLKFASKVKKGSLSNIAGIKKTSEVHGVTYKEEDWIVGEGNSFIGAERYFEESYEMALLTAIALATSKRRNPVEINLVLGVPVEHYDELADKIQEHYENLGIKQITVDGKLHIIDIKSVGVFIEGALPIKDNDDTHMITIDVGAGTINIIEWEEQEIVNKYTNNGSFNDMYVEISSYLNAKHKTRLNPDKVEKLMGETTMETLKGDTVDITDMYDIVRATIGNVLSYTVKFDFAGAKKIYVFGGGAKETFKFWKEKLPKAEIVEDYQFVNQGVYQAVAETISDEE